MEDNTIKQALLALFSMHPVGWAKQNVFPEDEDFI